MEGAGVQVDTLVVSSVATGMSVLEPEEMQEGVILADIGGGVTDIAVYEDGALAHTAVLPVGGVNVTRDLVVGLRCPYATAEEAKLIHAHATPESIDPGERVALEAFGHDHKAEIPRQMIAEIVQARVEEILAMVAAEARRAGLGDHISAGLVLTGGTAALPGVARLAEERLQLPARVGHMGEVYGLVDTIGGPDYATTLGVLRWMTEAYAPTRQSLRLQAPRTPNLGGLFRGVGRLGRVFLPQ